MASSKWTRAERAVWIQLCRHVGLTYEQIGVLLDMNPKYAQSIGTDPTGNRTLKRQGEWKRANRDKVNLEQQRRRAANPEQERAYGRADYERHRAKRLAKNAAWIEANPERKRELRRESHERHAPENRARVKLWRKANPEKVKAYKHEYRARVRGADRIVEHFTRVEIAERDGWTCHLCAGDVTRADWSIDHLIPISKGGDHTRENVKLAHMLCNARRGNRDLELAGI